MRSVRNAASFGRFAERCRLPEIGDSSRSKIAVIEVQDTPGAGKAIGGAAGYFGFTYSP